MSSKFKIALLVAASSAAFAISPSAKAQAVCEIAGAANTENTNGAVATDPEDLACGDNATADGAGVANGATAVGAESDAVGADATAFGSGSNAAGGDTTAIGADAGATANGATAIGNDADASGLNSVAVGIVANAHGETTIAIGNQAVAGPPVGGSAVDHDGVAIGDQAQSTGFHSTAIGGEAVASGAGAQAFGWRANATGTQSTAVGNQAQATGTNSTSLGNGSQATGASSTAVGNGSIANSTNATALGQNSRATQANATAVGQGANANFAGSTAVGFGATTTAANQVTLGGAGSSVRVGDIAASTAAQQASTVGFATVDANGVLGRSTINLNTIASLQGQVGTLFDLADESRRDIKEANEGIAMAMAMETPSIPAGAHFAVSGGVGYFKKQAALATAISAAVGEMSMVSAGVSYGFDSKKVGARAGFQFAF